MVILKTVIFTLLVPVPITMGVPYLLLTRGPGWLSYETGPFRLLGIVPIALGAATYVWCAWEFAAAGRGTPAPLDPPRALVTRGLYRLTRNPIYVGVLLVLIGEAVLFESLALVGYALVVWLWFHLFVVGYEERALGKKFGAAYDAYCRTVPRWIPDLRKLR